VTAIVRGKCTELCFCGGSVNGEIRFGGLGGIKSDAFRGPARRRRRSGSHSSMKINRQAYERGDHSTAPARERQREAARAAEIPEWTTPGRARPLESSDRLGQGGQSPVQLSGGSPRMARAGCPGGQVEAGPCPFFGSGPRMFESTRMSSRPARGPG